MSRENEHLMPAWFRDQVAIQTAAKAQQVIDARDAVTLLRAAEILQRRIPRRLGRDIVIRSLRTWAATLTPEKT